jgi:hypothetical protein
MLSGGELADHLWAVTVTIAAVGVPGYALACLLPAGLRRRACWTAWPLLGSAYWAVALYLLPFRGGLLVAAGVAVLGAVSVFRRRHRGGRCPRFTAPGVVLVIGCLPYFTPVFTQHVPQGMDASRYMLTARVIAAHGGLPATLAPIMPAVPCGATNHGVPAIAAVAVLAGASPPAATLATAPLSFAALVLSLYTILRIVTRRTSAAVLAVSVVWLTHQVQQTLGWGGFPGVLTLAVGFWAAWLLVAVLRGKGGSLALGLCIGALPALHVGVGATWLHILAPVAALVGLHFSRRRRRGLRAGLLAMLIAGAFVGTYYTVGHPQLAPETEQVFRSDALASIFLEHGPGLLIGVARYMIRGLGSTLSCLCAAALAVLICRRRWFALAAIVAPLALTFLVLLNAKYEFLATSLLLFPERVRDVPLAAAALALGFGWREGAGAFGRRSAGRARPTSLPCCVAASLLLALALTHHYRFYQKTAFRPEIADEEWRALRWAQANLDPATDFVATMYGTSGAYLPGVAGLPVTRWHAHPVDQLPAAQRQAATRPVTHVWLIDRDAVRSPIGQRDYDTEVLPLRALLAKCSPVEVFAAGPVHVYLRPATQR